jgi:hypothetical protein
MVTISDLENGLRPRVSEKEFAALRGCSQSTLQKERLRGCGPKFLKDLVTQRIYYPAESILEFFDRAVACRSTSDYDTKLQQSRLETARAKRQTAKNERAP